MSKGQQRSNREAKKPKKVKSKDPIPASNASVTAAGLAKSNPLSRGKK